MKTLSVSRRAFLWLGAAMFPTVAAPSLTLAQADSLSILMVVVRTDSSAPDPDLLRTLLSEFFNRGIPVTLMLDAAKMAPGPQNGLNDVIGRFAASEGGLFELAVPLDVMAGQQRYFQMRAAGGLRKTLDANLGAGVARQVVSLVDSTKEGGVDLPAFRSAGFRVLLRPGEEGDFAAEFSGRGQLVLSGGTVLPLAEDPVRVTAALDSLLRARRDGLLSLSLADVDAAGAEATRLVAAAIADRLAAAALAGSLHLTRPADYLLQFGPPHLTEAALLLPSPEPGQQEDIVRTFAAMLQESGIAFSLVSDSRPDWLPDEAGRVERWPGPAGAGFPPQGPQPLAVLLTELVPDHNLPPVSTVLHGEASRSGPTALRADGRLHIAVEDWADLNARGWPTCESIAIRITPGDIATPMQRAAVLHKLLAEAEGSQTLFLTHDTLADQLMAPDPVYTRLWSTLHRQVTDPPLSIPLSRAERASLLEDARVAFTFIDRFTDPTTGLAAGTVQDGPARRINRDATFWDIASQIQGIVAAAQLGIIPRDEARDRLALMLDHLPVIPLEGHTLPPAMFDTVRGTIVRRAFDICDTGRFLVALDFAVKSGFLDRQSADALVGSWDLGAAVLEGKPYNHDGRRWRDVAMSHCTPYIAPGFAKLGLPLISPYPDLSGAGQADGRMSLLYAVARMGSFGTEPLLLQAIERGPTPETAFLADLLFYAQLDWFETTGQLKCVSEIPLNVAPWFTYQGLRVDRLGAEGWTILSGQDATAVQSREPPQGIELLSAKSAYLWRAVHPHPYSNHLLTLIRDKARIEGFGFSVGLYASTLEPMKNYSDLNTNGVILAAIAAMLQEKALHKP